VIEGQIDLTVGQQEFRLKTGDSFFFRSSLPHSYRNTTSQISKVVWINAPPTF
jgi:mannose-6-phosphate isomerase-like protein (cupin superfamily)